MLQCGQAAGSWRVCAKRVASRRPSRHAGPPLQCCQSAASDPAAAQRVVVAVEVDHLLVLEVVGLLAAMSTGSP
jgi:hypothetical protein